LWLAGRAGTTEEGVRVGKLNHFSGFFLLRPALTPAIVTGTCVGPDEQWRGFILFAKSGGGSEDEEKRTVRAGRRRRTETEPGERERAEAPKRRREQPRQAPPTGGAGTTRPAGVPALPSLPGGGLPAGLPGGLSPKMILIILVVLVVCVLPLMLLFGRTGGGDSAGGDLAPRLAGGAGRDPYQGSGGPAGIGRLHRAARWAGPPAHRGTDLAGHALPGRRRQGAGAGHLRGPERGRAGRLHGAGAYGGPAGPLPGRLPGGRRLDGHPALLRHPGRRPAASRLRNDPGPGRGQHGRRGDAGRFCPLGDGELSGRPARVDPGRPRHGLAGRLERSGPGVAG
jgi:hypothetical protein